jgi:hypothetical protein
LGLRKKTVIKGGGGKPDYSLSEEMGISTVETGSFEVSCVPISNTNIIRVFELCKLFDSIFTVNCDKSLKKNVIFSEITMQFFEENCVFVYGN